jgi:hypothetical protein
MHPQKQQPSPSSFIHTLTKQNKKMRITSGLKIAS